jgi:hypothetical protein
MTQKLRKDGAAGAAAGMGNGPLAADNAWTGGKVHVNAIGSRPPHKKHVKPSFHKSLEWLKVFNDAKDDLPKLREERMEQQKESFKKALEPLWGMLIPGFPLEGEISRGRVYVHEGEQAPEGTPTQQGPRGGTYYEAQPHFKQGDLVAIKDMFSGKQGNEEAIFQGMQDGENPNAIVEVQSPYGNQTKFVDPQDLVFLAPGHHPDKGQKERREKRQVHAFNEVVTQFANTFRTAEKLEWNIWLHQDAYGKWAREELVRGGRDDTFERYRTDDGIEVFVPQGERKESALSLNRLMNYVSKMPPLAVQDLRKSVKRIILSPNSYVTDPHVWGTMNHDGDLTIYPNTKDIKAYSAGGFHGPDVGLPDIAVARVLTHETGHAVENRVEELRKPYYDKRHEFWDAYEAAGGIMPATDAGIMKIQRENGFPDPPTEEWWADYGDMKEIDKARYNPTEPKIPEYNIPAEVRGILPKLHRPEPLHDANDIYAWNDLPPKVKLALLEKIHRAKPVTGYAETNRAEYYAEAYEQFRYGILPSDHILYKHFEELPKIEAWANNPPEIHITKIWHRHGPADWNNDEGTYHAHENAEKGHTHNEIDR